MKLHAYFRSSTSYRLRIALELKGLDYEVVPVDLRTSEQSAEAFTNRNPFGSVPMLEADGREIYTCEDLRVGLFTSLSQF